MKKLLVMTLVLTLVCTMFGASFTSYAADSVVFRGNNVTAKAGDTAVEFTVSVENGVEFYLAGAKVGVGYNAEYFSIPARGYTDKKLFGSAGQFGGDTTANPFYYLCGEGYALEADGDLFVIKFNVAENTPAGTYPIEVVYNQADTVDDMLAEVPCTTVAGSITIESDEPTVPTAADLGLFTDATQNAKVTEKVMTSNGYSIEKALLFVSGINNDAEVVKYGTEITCEGFDKVLDIPCANFYDASETVKGFVAAVSSIRNDNLTKTFTAKAYADVTVGEKTVRIYATDAATAVYGN